MTDFEKITIVIAALGCLISIASILYTIFANKKNKKTIILLNSANLEVMISERISSAREQTDKAMLKIAEYAADHTKKEINEDLLKAHQKSFYSSLENYLTILDDACSKYIDDKIDKIRFRKTHKTSIKQLFENDTYKRFLDLETSPNFSSLMKLYKEWNE